MTNPEATIVDPQNLIGTVISDRYEVQEALGEGSMGFVFLAEHTHMKKKVAVKVMRPEFLENEEAVERFQREAQAAGHIDHPHVCAATDFGRLDDDRFFLVMEYLEGKSLGDLLSEEGPLLPERSVKIARRIALGLERAHELGVVHRDLKPDNIMLLEREGTEDFVKIMDFGVARVEVVSKQQLTQAGRTMGTPIYMSPEQAVAERADERSDLYSLGIMLFEMLTGSVPFHSESLAVILSKHTAEPPPSMHERAPDELIPLDLCNLVETLLAKDPEDRYQSARELIEAFDGADLTPYVPDVAPTRTTAEPEAREEPLEAAALEDTTEEPDDEAGEPVSEVAAAVASLDEKSDTADTVSDDVSGSDMFSSAEEVAPVKPIDIPSPSTDTTFNDVVERFHALSPAVRYGMMFTVVAVLAAPLIVAAVWAVSSNGTDAPTDGGEPAAMEFSEDDVEPAALDEERADFLDDHDLDEKFAAAGPAEAVSLLTSIEEEEASKSAHYHFLLGKAHVDNGAVADGMKHYLEALRLDPRYGEDGRIVSDATRIFGESKDEDAQPAVPVVVALLENDASGSTTTSVFDVGIEGRWAARKRSKKILEDSGRWNELEPWQRTAIDLRLTGKNCQRIKQLVNELAESAEPRALPALRKTSNRPRQGCGFLKKGDCYKCARADLKKAIETLEKAQGS